MSNDDTANRISLSHVTSCHVMARHNTSRPVKGHWDSSSKDNGESGCDVVIIKGLTGKDG